MIIDIKGNELDRGNLPYYILCQVDPTLKLEGLSIHGNLKNSHFGFALKLNQT